MNKKAKFAEELANVMIHAGLLDRAGFQAQIDEIMKWNTQACQAMARVVERHLMNKYSLL